MWLFVLEPGALLPVDMLLLDKNLVFFKFMIQIWWIYLPEDFRLPSATTQISGGGQESGFSVSL